MGSIFGEDSLFTGGMKFHERQAAAAALALRTPFMVLSGGPGTGKTSVVIQILRALMRAFPEIEPDRIVLCAPTGRAKARLGQSIDSGIEILELHPGPDRRGDDERRDGELGRLHRKTLHSLLAPRPDGTMKYHRGNPLPFQVIVVDEASMVDISLFSALLDAASRSCRIILVGDMHQLPSVAAGAVLGDLTERFNESGGFATLSEDTGSWLASVLRKVPMEKSGESLVMRPPGETGTLMDRAVILTRSFRSSELILRVGGLVNRGRDDEVLKVVQKDTTGAVRIETGEGDGPIGDWIREHYREEKLVRIRDMKGIDLDRIGEPEIREIIDACFAVLDESRILTLVHEGSRGRRKINELSAEILRERLGHETRNGFFHGQPVILGKNLHDLDLYNGDTGVVVRSGDGSFKAIFRRGEKYLVFALDRIPDLEPAFAITVHKSQGSEFDSVLLVLPERQNPLLTRQVIYTGITRARKKVVILGSGELLSAAIKNREERSGGIDV